MESNVYSKRHPEAERKKMLHVRGKKKKKSKAAEGLSCLRHGNSNCIC